MPRWIIRPRNISTTPHALATHLNCQTRKYPSARNIRRGFDFHRDFFLVYPDPDTVRFRVLQPTVGADGRDIYERLYRFFSQTKAGQRKLLKQAGIPVPDTTTRQDVAASWLVPESDGGTSSDTPIPAFIVRPLRHAGGIGFRLTSSPTDFREGEYVQKLFPKTREYRLVYVRGQLVTVLRKRVQEGTQANQPWNHHVGATFQTINDIPACRLTGTDCFTRLSTNPIIQSAHLVAVDVLWNRQGYVVCEFNSCPGLTIENNLLRIVQHVQAAEVVR